MPFETKLEEYTKPGSSPGSIFPCFCILFIVYNTSGRSGGRDRAAEDAQYIKVVDKRKFSRFPRLLPAVLLPSAAIVVYKAEREEAAALTVQAVAAVLDHKVIIILSLLPLLPLLAMIDL